MKFEKQALLMIFFSILTFFIVDSYWDQSYHIKPPMACSVDDDAFFDTHGVSGDASMMERKEFEVQTTTVLGYSVG